MQALAACHVGKTQEWGERGGDWKAEKVSGLPPRAAGTPEEVALALALVLAAVELHLLAVA
jgi:hypothetical protein